MTTQTKVLTAALVLDVVLAVLVTPAGGMDPRPPTGASALTWTCVGIYMVGLLTSVAGIVQLLRAKPIGPTLSLGPVLFFGVITADRLDAFHAEVAPAAIRNLEWTVAVVSVVVLALAMRARQRLGAKSA
jgi:hypothetical protein